MKKTILLLSMLMLSGVAVHAVDWQPLNPNVPDVELYIDLDSLKGQDNLTFYSIKYKAGDQPEKVAYIKSDSDTDYVGIIQAGDYDEETYRPNSVLRDPHVFMKPVNKDSFLYSAHKYAIAIASNQIYANNGDVYAAYTSEKPLLRDETLVSYNEILKTVMSEEDLENYLITTCKSLEQNWTAPSSGHGSRTIIVLTIGADGSLLNYKFLEPSGDTMTDRSVISAAEKTVPYAKFPSSTLSNVYSLDFKFVFENDVVRKSVVY